jgi:hypothetical protein
MSAEVWNFDAAGHSETAFEKRPIEGLAVEGDQDGALRDASGEFMEERVLLGEIAKEKLLDLQATSIPPRETDEEGVGAGSPGQASGFGVQEEPLLGIPKRGVGTSGEPFIAGARE